MIGGVVRLGIYRQMRSFERGQIEVRDGLWITECERHAAGEIDLTEDAHVLIRRHWIPINPGPTKIIGQSWEYLDCQGIDFAHARCIADVQLMPAERTGDLIRSGNLFSVEPDVGAKIDAIEMQPDVPSAITGRHLKFSSIPPGNAEGTVFRHRPQREVCSDWIAATRHHS